MDKTQLTNWLYYPTAMGGIVLMTLLVIATLPLLAASDDVEAEAIADEIPTLESQLESVMVHLCRTVPRHVVNRDPAWRKRLVAHIVEASAEYGLDPFLMTVIMFCESSFKMSAVGKLGEVGLGQVHGLAARGCDLSTERGQVQCTARWLAYARSLCNGSDKQMIARYATGRTCDPPADSRLERLVNYRLRLRRRMKGL